MLKVSRHQERIWALQVLYGLDILDSLSVVEAKKGIANLKDSEVLCDENYYFEDIVIGVVKGLAEYDRKINELAIDWKVERMSYIDRNILRMALYELKEGLAQGVVINEAVELAKEFSDDKSPAFINGILGKVNK
ncbi:transcription antitermination factor NusB [Halocella sp. SP3-1]|uniref:transcription antitermination factor NusB n=1 Tax=Halocella sp. SP3-1 TaxID=2382161 RepID=UPI002570523C|nr:transcription antitermination factor NusB [Halocella sp. SP3-1]